MVIALGKSIGPLIHPISIGLVSAWIIGVFFGTGLSSMTRRSDLAAGIASASLRALPPDASWPSRSMSGPDRLFPSEPLSPHDGAADRDALRHAVAAKPQTPPDGNEHENHPLSAHTGTGPGTLDSATHRASIGRNRAQAPLTPSPGKGQQHENPQIRRTHRATQAIEDPLHKHLRPVR
jgi:hypothetical protein